MVHVMIFPLFRLVVIWIAGVSLASHYCLNLGLLLPLLAIGMLSYVLLYSYTSQALWGDIMALIVIFLMGYSHICLDQATQKKLSASANPLRPLHAYCVCIEKVYRTKHHTYHCKSLLKFMKKHQTWYKSQGTVQLVLPKDIDSPPKPGDILLIYGAPFSNTNLPFKKILHQTPQHGPFYRHVLKHKHDFIQLIDQPTNKLPFPERIRLWYTKRLQQYMPNNKTIAFIEAILFSYKENLSPTLRQAYANTGTVHILVVSGLHVAMLYGILHMIWGKLLCNSHFTLLAESCMLMVLWLYAWLCTFSPPIVRATTMITMDKISTLLQRQNHSYNALFGSAFFLLVWNPWLLFNISFQFSYLATLGIIGLQLYIYRMVKVKIIGLNALWKITALSLAAQIATCPLALHYFKQFPVYFIIANWFVIPAIFLILILSILWMPCSFIPLLNPLLTFLLHKTIELTNTLVYWIETWPYSIIHTYTSWWSVSLLYLFILFCAFFLTQKNRLCFLLFSLSRLLN